jgi:hypothetical protein
MSNTRVASARSHSRLNLNDSTLLGFSLLRLSATLVTMNDTAQRPGPGADDLAVDDPDSRLAAYVARTQTALDLLALATLWIVVVPPGDFSTSHDVRASC